MSFHWFTPPNGHIRKGWSRLKPGVLFSSPPWMAGACLDHLLLPSQVPGPGTELEAEQSGLKPALQWGMPAEPTAVNLLHDTQRWPTPPTHSIRNSSFPCLFLSSLNTFQISFWQRHLQGFPSHFACSYIFVYLLLNQVIHLLYWKHILLRYLFLFLYLKGKGTSQIAKQSP